MVPAVALTAVVAAALQYVPQIPAAIVIGNAPVQRALVSIPRRIHLTAPKRFIIGPKNYGKRDASLRSRSNRRKR